MYIIETPRLRLLACDLQMVSLLIEDVHRFESVYGLSLVDQWTSFGTDPLNYTLKLLSDPTQANWWTYLPVLKAKNLVIGTCGYKGKPDDLNRVEIGYEIAPSFRQNAYGLELAKALILDAFQNRQVDSILAHTLPHENASTAILKHCGMQFISSIEDPEDGLIWKWELQKTDWLTKQPN
ncbi:MAG: GNAT family N-acetyltransferase [Saprospiraceae bacterium]